MDYLNKSNIIIDLNVNTKEEALEIIIGKMYKNGYVKKEYLKDVLEREENYPTGLPTEVIKVAIPHAKKENVIISCLGIVTLKNPVKFKNIADDSEILEVEIIFVLANKDEEKQLTTIGNLMDLFSESDKLEEIKNCKNQEDLIMLLQDNLVENK